MWAPTASPDGNIALTSFNPTGECGFDDHQYHRRFRMAEAAI